MPKLKLCTCPFETYDMNIFLSYLCSDAHWDFYCWLPWGYPCSQQVWFFVLLAVDILISAQKLTCLKSSEETSLSLDSFPGTLDPCRVILTSLDLVMSHTMPLCFTFAMLCYKYIPQDCWQWHVGACYKCIFSRLSEQCFTFLGKNWVYRQWQSHAHHILQRLNTFERAS